MNTTLRKDILASLKEVDAKQLLMLIAEAKTGRHDAYQNISKSTQSDTLACLEFYIEVAKDIVGCDAIPPTAGTLPNR